MIREAVVAIRQLRADYSVPPSAAVDVLVLTASARDPERATVVFGEEGELVGKLTTSRVRLDSRTPASAAAHALESLARMR